MKQNLQNPSEILDLMAKIQAQLTSLDRKVDSLISRALPKPANTSVPVNRGPNEHRNEKMMYQAICADCKKECSIPFKPSGDRPVYCKECFSIRKNGGTAKANTDNTSKVVLPFTPFKETISAPALKEKKKKAAVKKTLPKKKPVAKKKKK